MAGVFTIRIPQVVARNSGTNGSTSARFCTPQSSQVRPARRGVLTTEKRTHSRREPSDELSSSARHARSVAAHPGPRGDGAVVGSAVAHPRDDSGGSRARSLNTARQSSPASAHSLQLF
jgi:hypothetical protein